jgi:hypothetical protein
MEEDVVTSLVFLEELSKSTKAVSQNSRCHCRDSNWAICEYISNA